MVIKVYISGISSSKEVKKRQQRVMMILDSKCISYDPVDITEPGREDDKEFMKTNSKSEDKKCPLTPQIFNDETYCGDYDSFDLANENDTLEAFLNVSGSDIKKRTPPPEIKPPANGAIAKADDQVNGSTSREGSSDKESTKEAQKQPVPAGVDEEGPSEDARAEDDQGLQLPEAQQQQEGQRQPPPGSPGLQDEGIGDEPPTEDEQAEVDQIRRPSRDNDDEADSQGDDDVGEDEA